MQTAGVICEYNPFHLGHARQLGLIRQQLGQEAEKNKARTEKRR